MARAAELCMPRDTSRARATDQPSTARYVSMALSFHPTTTAPLFHLGDDMSFLQDVHPEVTDALLGFVYDPLDPAVHAGIDGFLNPLPDEDDQHCAKSRARAGCGDDALLDFTAVDGCLGGQPWNEGGDHHQVLPEFLTDFVLPLPPPPPPPQQQQQQQQMPPAFVRGADAKKAEGKECQSVQSAAARERRKRISEKTAELSRLIPGGHKLNTAEMLQAAGRHVKLLQAQVGILALMHTIKPDKIPSMAVDQMRALLVCGSMQERLAAEGRCLVPRKLVDGMAKDSAIKSNALVNRDLRRFMESLE